MLQKHIRVHVARSPKLLDLLDKELFLVLEVSRSPHVKIIRLSQHGPIALTVNCSSERYPTDAINKRT